MSTPANPGPEEKKTGLSKIVSRMKTVLKRSDGSKRLSFSGRAPVATTSPATPSAPAPVPAAAAAAPSPEPVPATATPLPATVEPTIDHERAPGGPQPVKVMRSQIDAERARRLGERFKLTIEVHDFAPSKLDKETYRVEKPIRMRIHRSCHICGTSFGGNKICASCSHPRCVKCPRYPAKRTKKDDKEEEKGKPAASGGTLLEADPYFLDEKIVLTIPSKTGGQPLVWKRPMQRVRRNCHTCSTVFPGGSKICPSCQHIRCADCPREPPKKKHYPHGYPGDAPSTNPLLPRQYSCHKCRKLFPPIVQPASPEGLAIGSSAIVPECSRCHHLQCSECPRAPFTKAEPTLDPEIVKSVEKKLAAITISSPAQTTA